MFHDPDFTPFEPTTGRLAPLAAFVRTTLRRFRPPLTGTVFRSSPDIGLLRTRFISPIQV
jgi:hypothetical protein